MFVDRVEVIIPEKDRELPIFGLRVELLQSVHRELTRCLLEKFVDQIGIRNLLIMLFILSRSLIIWR